MTIQYINENKRKISFELQITKNPEIIQKYYVWAVFLGLIIVSIIAQLKFPSNFSYINNSISDQGSVALNPSGNLIWRIGVIINGIAHIPHICYIYTKIHPISSLWAKISTGFGVIAAINFSLVGLISLDCGISHYIVAIFAFVGYYIAGILDFIILYKERSPVKDLIRNSRSIKFFITYYILSGAACLFSFILSYRFPFFMYVYPPLEWNYLLAICLWLLMWPQLFLHIKRESKNRNRKHY